MAKEWIELFNGKDLTGWKMKDTNREHKWIAKDGALKNTTAGVDIITEQEFGDFELHIEYLVPKDSNSGIYLRGQYELQVLDSLGKKINYPGENGALYNQKSCDVEASKPAGEWQAMDITLKGLVLNVTLNDKVIHKDVTIKGPTGGELKSGVNPPKGPLMLQGDHGPVLYRNIRIREF